MARRTLDRLTTTARLLASLDVIRYEVGRMETTVLDAKLALRLPNMCVRACSALSVSVDNREDRRGAARAPVLHWCLSSRLSPEARRPEGSGGGIVARYAGCSRIVTKSCGATGAFTR